MLQRLLFCSVLSVCALGLESAQALDITTRGDVLTLSGPSVGMDKYALKKALTPAIHTVVLDAVKGRDFEEGWELADVIKVAKVTTVVKGFCGYNCVRMFLSGQQRMFDAGQLSKTILFISGNAALYDSSSVIYTDAAKTAARLSMPRSLVEKWAFNEQWGGANQFKPAFMLVTHPSISHNGRSFLGCPGGTGGKEIGTKCAPIEDYDALKAGVVTTLELFHLPRRETAAVADDSTPIGQP